MQRLKKIFGIYFSLITCAISAQVMPSIKFHEIENKKLAYYEEGTGETIILLHGWPQTSYVWRKVIPELSKTNHILAIDLPGLGNSEEINSYTTENVSAIIHQFVLDKKIKKFHLVGHDLGTWVALTYAIKYESDLSTLTLVDAGIPGLMDEKVFQPENANKIWQFYFHGIDDLPELLTEGKEDIYFDWYFTTKSFVKDAITTSDKKEYVNQYKKVGKMKVGFDYYRAFMQNAKFNKNNIKTFNIPILAIGGTHALGKNVGNALLPYTKNLINLSLENSGHYVPEEQPKIFSEKLIEFITKKNKNENF
jgi:pimeloyl-ACP methyl ester carboxylesterase